MQEDSSNITYRTHARSAYLVSVKAEEGEIREDETIELMLDEIYSGINQKVVELYNGEDKEDFTEDDMSISVEFESSSEFEVRNEVVLRLQDYGYEIKLIAPTQEEADLLMELEELAMSDESVMKQLNEYKRTVLEYKVIWLNAMEDDYEGE